MRFALRTVVWPGGSSGPSGSGSPSLRALHRVVPHLLFQVSPEVELRDHRLAPETVVAVGGIQKAPVAPLVLVELDDGAGPLLAHARQPRQRLEISPGRVSPATPRDPATSAVFAAARLSTPRTLSRMPCTLSGQTLRLRWSILRTAVKAL